MGRKKEATLEDVRFEITRLHSCLNIIDERLKKLAPATTFPQIPPAWILKAARANLNIDGHSWQDYYSILDDFYGLPHTKALIDSSLDSTTLAVYRYATKTIYSRNKTMTQETALHEYFHKLKDFLRISTTGGEEQRLADAYAEACLEVEAEADKKAAP